MTVRKKCVCHVTACMFVHTGGPWLRTVLGFLFLFFLPSTGFPLSNTCTETFPINYKYFIRPLLFWKMRMISKANTHPVCLPVWIILFLRPSLPRHLSPQHCKEICSIEYWWTELYYGFFLLFFSFFLSVIFFFFLYCAF